MIKAGGFRLISTILGIIATCFMIYNYMSPDTTVKTAGHVATSASKILNRASTLVNGTSFIRGTALQMLHHFGYGEEEQRKLFIEKLQGGYINKETGILKKQGRRYLNRLYGNNKNLEMKL